MKNFKLIFGCHLGKVILKQTDNLSKSLQDSECTAVEGQSTAENTVAALAKIRSDESFEGFWGLVQLSQTRLGIDDASLPRKRKVPKRIDDHFKTKGDADTTHHPETPEEMYRQIYRDAVEAIKSRFDQPDFEVYKNIQEVFFKSLKGEQFSSELNNIHEVFGDDFKKDD